MCPVANMGLDRSRAPVPTAARQDFAHATLIRADHRGNIRLKEAFSAHLEDDRLGLVRDRTCRLPRFPVHNKREFELVVVVIATIGHLSSLRPPSAVAAAANSLYLPSVRRGRLSAYLERYRRGTMFAPICRSGGSALPLSVSLIREARISILRAIKYGVASPTHYFVPHGEKRLLAADYAEGIQIVNRLGR